METPLRFTVLSWDTLSRLQNTGESKKRRKNVEWNVSRFRAHRKKLLEIVHWVGGVLDGEEDDGPGALPGL